MPLTHQEVGGQDRAFPRGLPRAVTGDAFPRPVGVVDIKHAADCRHRTVNCSAGVVWAVAHEQAVAEITRIPAVGQHCREAVWALLGEQRGDVVAAGGHTLVIVAPAWGEEVVGNPLAIDGEVHDPQSGAMENSPFDLSGGGKGGAEMPRWREMQGGGIGVQRWLACSHDPLAAPVVCGEQPEREAGHVAPRIRRAIAVAELHPPKHLLSRGERRAGIDHTQRVGGGYRLRIPEVGPARLEEGGIAGDQHAVTGLALAWLLGANLPREARRGGRDSHRFS